MSSEMAETAPKPGSEWRDRVLTDPDLILNDRDVMRALIAANDRHMGDNIVDMRGMAMERLESRLEGLEDVHRSVIAAAYANVSGTNQVHRAVLMLLDQPDFPSVLNALHRDVAPALKIDRIRLVLERAEGATPVTDGPSDALTLAAPGFVQSYLGNAQTVTLRPADITAELVFGPGDLGSEALLALDLGDGRLPAMLAMGAMDPQQFHASQGTELLTFFACVVERVLIRWLDQTAP